MQRIQGWVEDGNIIVHVSGTGYISSTKVQGSFPSSTISVYLAGTLTLASIYADNVSTAKANPFTASSTGQWFFYAPNGSYDVKFSGGGISAPFTLGAITLFDESIIWIDVTAAPYLAKGNGTTDDTASITAAIAALAITGTPNRLYFPAGTYKITSTITFSSLEAVEIFGPGDGITSGSGATLKWAGAANGTVVTVSSVSWSHIHDIKIDGDNIAGKGWALTTGATSTQCNTYERLSAINFIGTTPGYGFHRGASSNPDVSQSLYLRCTAINCKHGLYQEGTQTVANADIKWTFSYTGTVTQADVTSFMTFAAGDISTIDCVYLGAVTTAQIQIDPLCLKASFAGNYHENGSVVTAGPAYKFPAGNRPYPTAIERTRIQWNPTNALNKIIDWNQNDLFSVDSCVIDTDSGTGAGTITLTNGSIGTAQIRWSNTKINGTATISVSLGANIVIFADPSALLFFGASSPAPTVLYGPGTRLANYMIAGTDPRLTFYQTDASASNKFWDVIPISEDLTFRALNDAQNAATSWMVVHRTGMTVDDVTFPSPAKVPDQAMDATWNGSTKTPTQNAIWDALGVLTDAWTAWTPTYASDIGNAAATYSGGTVTTDVARYLVVGKTLIMQIGFHGTLNAVTPNYLSVTLPASLQVLGSISGNVYASNALIKNNNLSESGAWRAITNTLQFYRIPFAGNYTASQPAGLFGSIVIIETS